MGSRSNSVLAKFHFKQKLLVNYWTTVENILSKKISDYEPSNRNAYKFLIVVILPQNSYQDRIIQVRKDLRLPLV